MTATKNLLIGGVNMGKGRLKNVGPAVIQVRNDIEDHLIKNEYLKTAPFDTVSLIFRYGITNNWDPDINPVDQKNSELPVAIEFDSSQLKSMSADELKKFFRLAVIEVLCDIAANYDLPYEFLDKLREN